MDDEQILDAYRRWGYLEAQVDPLERLPRVPHPEMEAQGAAAERASAIYCGSIGAEFMYIADPERQRWVAERMESPAPEPDRAGILERLVEADVFEQVTAARYPGAKRFSLEGSTALIPLLDQVLDGAGEYAGEQAILAMSHRGRLTVLVTVLGKSPADVFANFEDADPRSVLGGGDVKYHLGATGDYLTPSGRTLRVSLVSNPSHLEAVDPVMAGRARAKQARYGPGGRDKVLPIMMHGDAAFAGQGIVAETLNLANLEGYTVGGTIHVVVNNMIGFTATPPVLHSTRFATDVAKRLDVPIFHVNGEDPEAVVRVARLALDYRYHFHSDVVIDLIGYRRQGHSEVDDPTITQPGLYRQIQATLMLSQSYAQRTGAGARAAEELAERVRARLQQEQAEARKRTSNPVLRDLPAYWDRFAGGPYDPAYEVDTGAATERLAGVAERLAVPPQGFHVHPRLKRLLEQRREMGRGRHPVDWAMAELLAFGALLGDGVRVRLSGQDTRRGTFNQRHSVLVDEQTEAEYCGLKELDPGQGVFEVYDSPLSEAAPLGFEYGFSRDFPEALVLWEAQFGDFANGAQMIIDQFVSATEDKWQLLSGLVMLLPHGFEGQGPDHSSARLERFLQLCGEDNMQVCQPSTAAQYFHLLRRQALRHWRKPLVVFTPKSLLRYPKASSPLEELARGRFLTVVPDREVKEAEADRILVCSGKMGHDLRAERERRKDPATAVVLLDQLYPFPEKELAEQIARYPKARDIVWVQEEPANMGALFFVQPRLHQLARGRSLRSIKRSASASPATGSTKAHALEQAAILGLAFARAEPERRAGE